MAFDPNTAVLDTPAQNKERALTFDPSTAVLDEAPSSNKPFLPKRQATEEVISQRPDSVSMLKESMKPPSNLSDLLSLFTMNPVQRMVSMAPAAATALTIPFQRGEATVAAPALEMQAGNFNLSDLARAAGQGLSGQRPAQLGDLIRTTGFGGKLNEPLSSLTGLLAQSGLVGGAMKAGQKVAPIMQKTVSDITNKISQIPNFPKQSISRIRDYAGNKVLAIRSGAKQYWGQEINAYGKTIDSMASNPSNMQGGPLMESMTKTMVDRNLYDPINEKWVRPLNKVDAQFVRSYSALGRRVQSGEKLTLGEIIKEYQNIKNSAPIDSPLGRDARNMANSLINSIKDQIDIPAFKQANARYTEFRNNFDQIDKMIDVWGNPFQTGRAEKFLTRRLGETAESRKTAQAITQKTGQTLKWAKALSALQRLPGVKWIR
jgi:hypothetical protein